ncbi:hypothetical protein D3C76_1727140 [compost metagenome]
MEQGGIVDIVKIQAADMVTLLIHGVLVPFQHLGQPAPQPLVFRVGNIILQFMAQPHVRILHTFRYSPSIVS